MCSVKNYTSNTALLCVISKITRNEESCTVESREEGLASATEAGCLMEDTFVECYYKPGDDLIDLVKSQFSNSSGQQNCGTAFIEYFWQHGLTTSNDIFGFTKPKILHKNASSSEKVFQDARRQLIRTASARMFWIFCVMTLLMLCQIILLSMLRTELTRLHKPPPSLDDESPRLDAQRTNTATLSTSRSAVHIALPRT
ncbi:hypothetical protein OESDEN_02999 [Oesophagostomum dentatum]|uniref:Uncharacterized protein n=1 Tax=Oesophagostomum dentatum TaxID=61180 RepID=A0A0B1THK4_OESDE|nr:hypothetical protein OESDEN_02999 [Oesophagostomum dentatum]